MKPDIQDIKLDIHSQYGGNPRLKRMGVEVQMTEEMVEEYVKCSQDYIYFIENYCKFITLNEGLTNIELHDFQKNVLKTYNDNRFSIFKCPRQAGKTTITVGYILWYILFQEHKNVGVLAQKEKTSKEILTRIKTAYEYLPIWMQQGIDSWSMESITLENGCKVMAEATASGAIRGFTIALLYLDEFAHVPSNIAEEFFTSVYPTISSGIDSKIIMTSTPNGLNLFYRFWIDAKKEKTNKKEWNGFKAIEAHWQDVPGRDQAWADAQLSVLKEQKFAQEVECEFLGSSNTLIGGKTLRELAFIDPIKRLLDDGYAMYEDVIPNHSYVISVDTSRGQNQDASAFVVIDVTTSPWRVVGKYKDSNISTMLYPNYIYQAAVYYNNAYVLIENNDLGGAVAQTLHYDLEYDNMFFSMSDQNSEMTASQSSKAKILGVRTTPKTKNQGCNRLKTLIENKQLFVQDFDIVSELSTFVLGKSNKWGAEPGYHDDTVTCLYLFAWLTTQPIFKDLSDPNLRKAIYEGRIKQAEESLTPAPIILDQKQRNIPYDKWEGAIFVPVEIDYDEALRMLNNSYDD